MRRPAALAVRPTNRKALQLCALLLALFALLSIPGLGSAQTTRVRIMAANISSGNNQSYDPGHGIRIFQGLDPDIVLLQEFKYGANTTADWRAFVDTAFGTNYQYYREPQSGGIPNGIISKYPILQAGEWDDTYVSDRDFAWARIDIPGSKDLWVVSVHFLTSSATNRNNQATLLRSRVQSLNIPAGDFLVIGGDFNTGSRSESCLTTLSSLVLTGSPYPVDKNNNGNTNAGRNSPYDWVCVNSALNAYKTPVVVGSSSFTNGLVFDSRVYTPLSEVAPVQSGDSGATGMQHMAVVKDFLVPSGGSATPTPTATASPTATPAPTATPTATPAVTATPSPTATPSGTVLTSGVPASGSVTAGAWRNYTITVPSGATSMQVTLTGSQSDADLYLRKAGLPTTSTYDYRSNGGTSNESLTVTQSSSPVVLGTGTWNVCVYGYSNTVNFTLTATITSSAPTATPTPTPAPSATPTATPTPASGDIYEVDNTFAAARTITVNGATQTHDISPASDNDYIVFTLSATANIRIETNGPANGDTFISLYNGSQSLITTDDDAGTGYYSLISRASLAPGTYYVKIASYNNQTTIAGYTVRVYTY